MRAATGSWIPSLGKHLTKTIRQKTDEPQGHCNPTFINQDLEATRLSISRWNHKEDVDLKYRDCGSAIKKNIVPFATTLADTEIIILLEGRQIKTNHIWFYHLEAESKNVKKHMILQNRNILTVLEKKLTVVKGEKWGRRINQHTGTNIWTQIPLK